MKFERSSCWTCESEDTQDSGACLCSYKFEDIMVTVKVTIDRLTLYPLSFTMHGRQDCPPRRSEPIVTAVSRLNVLAQRLAGLHRASSAHADSRTLQ
jgi:hypothetical protein